MKLKQAFNIIWFTCACALPIAARAQVNLVLNPSYEQYDTCPDDNDEIYRADYWSAIDTIGSPFIASAPQYANTCATSYLNSVPANSYFDHNCRTGNGMAFAGMYYDETGSFWNNPTREYTQGRLYTNLTAGQSYCVTFYVVMANKNFCAYACNNIGAYLDNGIIDTVTTDTLHGDPHYADSVAGKPLILDTPQIVETQIINDSINWTKIQGSFIATGTERFITIGNFSDKAHTSTQFLLNPADTSGFAMGGGGGSIYLIDDVSVIPSDALPNAGNDTTIYQNDSAFLGPNEIALPYTWYILGQTEAPIDSGGGIWVHPDSSTTYVLQQNLCGANTYDTVTVTVIPVSVGNVNLADISVYPNPATNEITIANAPQGSEVKIFNLIGQQVYETAIKNNRQTIDVSNLPNGSYLLQITASDGERSIQKIIIEK